MMWRWLFLVMVGILAGIWEIAILPFLPSGLGVRPLLPIAVLLLVSGARSRAFSGLIAGALVLDAYKWAYFDVATLRLAVVFMLLDVIAQRFLTNRSVYATIVLAVIVRGLDWLSSFILALVGGLMDSARYPWQLPVDAGWIILWDIVLVGMGFLLIASFTRRFATTGRVSDF